MTGIDLWLCRDLRFLWFLLHLKKKLERKVSNFISTDLEWLPINKLKLGKNHYDEVINFLDALEENDDIQKVFSNLEYEV